MPIDFTFLLAGRAPNLPEIFEEIELELFTRGFWRSREVIVSTGEDEVEREETLIVDSIAQEKERLRSWTSMYVEFSCSTFLGLGVQCDLRAGGYTDCFVTLERRAMHRLHKSGIPRDLYAAVATIATAGDSVGGYGSVAVSRDSVPPDQMMTKIIEQLSNRDLWSDVYILPKNQNYGSSAEAAWAPHFERIEEGTFVFLLNREFLRFSEESV